MFYLITWFILWGVLWAVYFMLDGFDLGVGILYPFLGKDEAKRTAIRASIGPVWDGNEVWLITAGGATFAAFPSAYATLFSELYLAMLLILFGLIIRGVSLEFRGKGEAPGWRRLWDAGFFVGSLVPAFLFGVAFGNLFRGLPIDAQGSHGSLLTLLTPYALLTGVLFVTLFVTHGLLWLAMKSGAGLGETALRRARPAWLFSAVVAVGFLVWSALGTRLAGNYLDRPIWLAVPLLGVASLILIRVFVSKNRPLAAFLASCATIVFMVFTGFVGLFPNLIPSRLDPESSLTIFNAASSPYTLKVMTVVAVIFVPIVIAYQAWVYRVFRGKPSGTY
ncbi:MAG: cytochrome d ubiquinol oxidase subunit II [Candidatus Aminicenantes bacterium RBG_16_63_16]|nr:MAG: cytochrome d ubiquinol oxidase subunit II [Candidatus Aminicenantes bacterium RBG_16_63_16]